MGTPSGWPFLVAAGRRRDYRTLLAPEFLVADLDYGILDQAVRPTPETGPATVVEVRTARGRPLTIVYATHRLTAADLIDPVPGRTHPAGRPADAPGPDAPGSDPRDEHGRPLRLIYGYATPDGYFPEPAPADLDSARTVALTTYRRFLADEERVEVTPVVPVPTALRHPRTTTTARADTVRHARRPYRAAAFPRRCGGWRGRRSSRVSRVGLAVAGLSRSAPPTTPTDCTSFVAALPRSASTRPPSISAPRSPLIPVRRSPSIPVRQSPSLAVVETPSAVAPSSWPTESEPMTAFRRW